MFSAAPPIRLYRGDGRLALSAVALVALPALIALFRWRPSDMKRLVLAVALASAATPLVLGLAGCGLTPASRGLAGILPNYEIRQAPRITCSDLLVRVDPEQRMTNAQQRVMVKVCEEMTKGVVIEPTKVQDAMRLSVPSPF